MLIASHGPHNRWVYGFFWVGVALAVAICIGVGLWVGGPDRRRRGALFGLWIGIASLPVGAMWAERDSVPLIIGIGAAIFIAPAVMDARPDLRADDPSRPRIVAALWVLVIATLALMIFGPDDWDNGNDWVAAYAAYAIGTVIVLLGSLVVAPRWFRSVQPPTT